MNVDRQVAEAVVELGRLVLQFGRVDRVTYHEDGVTPESDTDHTVMLGLIAPAFAARFTNLDVGLVASFANVHDLVEVYAGDVNTLVATADDRATKRVREAEAQVQIELLFGTTLPWVPDTIHEYELQRLPEARFVKAMDKLLPKVTHILNGGTTIHKLGLSQERIQGRYYDQTREQMKTVADMPELLELRARLLKMMDEAVWGTE